MWPNVIGHLVSMIAFGVRRKSRSDRPLSFGSEVAKFCRQQYRELSRKLDFTDTRSAVSNKGNNTRKEKNMLKALRSSKGFTLIELLIVVAIIGILAAIAIPQFAAYREKAYNSSSNSDLKNLKTGMEAYMADNQEYPVDVVYQP